MGRNNNNAGLHMIYMPKHKKMQDDYEDDYLICASKKYNTRSYREHMNKSILNSVKAVSFKNTVLCESVRGIHNCPCGGELRNLAYVWVSYSFENGRGVRSVTGLGCKECNTVYLVKDKILPVLKRDFYF